MRKHVRSSTANPSDQLTDFTVERPSSLSPQLNKKCRTFSSVTSEWSSFSDSLVEFKAQEKALQRAKKENKFAWLQKSVAELLKNSMAAVDDKDNNENRNLRLLPLISHFFAVKVKYLRQILNNKFDPINISHLCNNVMINHAYQSKYVDLGKNIKVKMKEEDALEFDIKRLAILMKSLLIYFQIQLYFTEDENVQLLEAAFALYQGRLCKYHSIYTWESVRLFHITFY